MEHVYVTLGSEGVYCRSAAEEWLYPALPLTEVTNTTGAGDAFWGGFLSALRIGGLEKPSDLTRELLTGALAYGNKCGWFCVQKKGAMSSLPTRAEVESLA